jgi:hypothetical protein
VLQSLVIIVVKPYAQAHVYIIDKPTACVVTVVKPFVHANITIEPSTQVDSVVKTTACIGLCC